MNNNLCEICGNDDLPCENINSQLGSRLFATCSICESMGAENLDILEGIFNEPKAFNNYYTYYDPESDMYLHWPSKIPHPILFINNREVFKRKEAIEWLNKSSPDIEG